MSPTASGPTFGDGYEIVESSVFLERIQETIGDIRRWDELRRGLDAWMHRMPTALPFSRRIRDDLWFVRVKVDPLMVLLYQANEAQRIVTYLDLEVFHDEVEGLDPAFDDLP